MIASFKLWFMNKYLEWLMRRSSSLATSEFLYKELYEQNNTIIDQKIRERDKFAKKHNLRPHPLADEI